MKRAKFWIVMLVVAAILGCSSKTTQTTTNERIITAKIETPVTQLFYSGSIQPISTIPLISPVDGRVDELRFVYGGLVRKGQDLVVVNAPDLSDQYRKNVTTYLEEKDKYYNASANYQGSLMLYNAGVIPKQQLYSDQSAYENESLNYFQALYDLEKTLNQIGIPVIDIERLTIRNLNVVNNLLRQQFSRLVIKANADGIALFPPSSSSDENAPTKLSVGSSVKNGQVMLYIGDFSGLTLQIQISEIDINRIKSGMSVQISGDAFPGIVLNGVVTNVATQANPDQSGGGGGGSALGMFNATVKVPHVTPEQRRVIHVGMTAKIELDIKESPQIMIPIQAVFTKQGQSYVTVVGSNGIRKDVVVETGYTSPTEVAITSGIKAGDKVVVHD